MKLLRNLLIFFAFQLQAAEGKPFVEGVILHQLGNQFFQVAAVYSLALDNDAEAYFPNFQSMNKWNIPENHRLIFWRFNAEHAPSKPKSEYREYKLAYSPIPYKPNMRVRGFFQSEKFFKHNKEKILPMFEPHQEIVDYLTNKYPEILSHPNSVAVHIRTYFTDFPKGSEFFVFQGWSYFEEVMRTFPEDSLFVICSDKIDLCKKNLSHLNRNLVFIENNQNYHDLYLMSFCKHNIISNSSFSWWAAYLNKNPEKIVIAPSLWFRTKMERFKTTDIIPEGWIVHPSHTRFM